MSLYSTTLIHSVSFQSSEKACKLVIINPIRDKPVVIAYLHTDVWPGVK